MLANLRTQLLARPAIVGPPAVAVHIIELGTWTEPELIVFTRVAMTGAGFLGWGAGAESLKTVEPLTLSGYVAVDVPGRSDDDAAIAMARAGVLLDEVSQQLRDDPTVLAALDGDTRWQPPLMTSAALTPWIADRDGVSLTSVRIDWTVAWQAVN